MPTKNQKTRGKRPGGKKPPPERTETRPGFGGTFRVPFLDRDAAVRAVENVLENAGGFTIIVPGAREARMSTLTLAAPAPKFARGSDSPGMTACYLSADSAIQVVLNRATEVIGDQDEALRWMGTPVAALNHATPISLVGTDDGRQAVLDVLGRLEHSVL